MNFRYLYAIRSLYFFMIGFLFYTLIMGRSGEIYTVWQAMPLFFIPAFFGATILLLAIVFSTSERVEYKLLFVIMYSILSRSFSAIVFPAGGVGPQQGEGLSATRLLFESTIRDGWAPWPPNNILILLFNWFRGENFQSVLSVVSARMLGVDVFWAHVWLAPMMWGVFVPVCIFALTRILGGNETTSVLASLMITAFPVTIVWGTFSVPNSLGYIFFLLSVLFFITYLSSRKPKILLLMAIFVVCSLLSHLLTGIVTFSLLLLTIAMRAYESEKREAPLAAITSLVFGFLLSTVLLPLSLLSLRVIYIRYVYFSLNVLVGLPPTEILSLLVLGEYANFRIEAIPVFLAGPVLGFIGIVSSLRRAQKKGIDRRASLSLLLLLGYLMVLVDHRILKLFVVNTPFNAERLLVFQYLMIAPFVALFINSVVSYLQKNGTRLFRKKINPPSALGIARTRLSMRQIGVYSVIAIILASWLTASAYYAYPHSSFLQITDYEIEAARYIETSTNKTYIVICDQWFAYAGGMIVGINNTRAFYFSAASRVGIELFNAMRKEPSGDTMNQTLALMEQDNLHFGIVYFVVEEPRLGTDEFNRVIANATENNVNVYHTFGNGKLCIFYYQRQT